MNKRAYKQMCKRIEALRDRWVEPLGLGDWTVTFTYFRKGKNYRALLNLPKQQGVTSLATCQCNWQYKQAWIGVNTPEWLGLSDYCTEANLVHELCHMLLDSLAKAPDADKQAHLESTCTALANAFIWTRKEARERGLANVSDETPQAAKEKA